MKRDEERREQVEHVRREYLEQKYTQDERNV